MKCIYKHEIMKILHCLCTCNMFRGMSFFKINFLFLIELLWQPSKAIVKLSLATITKKEITILIIQDIIQSISILYLIDCLKLQSYIFCTQ